MKTLLVVFIWYAYIRCICDTVCVCSEFIYRNKYFLSICSFCFVWHTCVRVKNILCIMYSNLMFTRFHQYQISKMGSRETLWSSLRMPLKTDQWETVLNKISKICASVDDVIIAISRQRLVEVYKELSQKSMEWNWM